MPKPSPKQLLLLLFGLVLLITEQAGWLTSTDSSVQPTKNIEVQQAEADEVLGETKVPSGFYEVVNVEDGDTITVNMNGVQERVRLIGVDTPETKDPRKPVQCFGEAASEFAAQLIGESAVRLVADPLSTNRDRYNRLLRYAYLEDGRLVQAEIIRRGYGFAYLAFPFEKSGEFKQLETEAREQGRGLWSGCKIKVDSKGYISTEY